MPTVKIQATEMKDATVNLISLVERGANRIPFRIIKQDKEQDMGKQSGLDLGAGMRQFFARKSEAPQAQILGVITLKEDGDTIPAQVEETGFLVTDVTEMEDGSVVFKQGDVAMEDADALIRINDHAVLATKGFRPYNMDFTMADGSNFSDLCKAQGFYPGIGTAMEVLRNSILTVAEKSDDPSAAAKEVMAMFGEASKYVSGMVQSLPAKAFKLEFLEVAPVAKGEGGEGGEGGTEKPADEKPAGEVEVVCSKCEAKKKPEDMVAKEDGTPGEECKECHAKATPAKKEEPPAPASGLTEEQVAAIVTKSLEGMTLAMKGITDTMATIQKSVEDVAGKVQTVQEKVVEVESVAKAAKDAANSIVLPGGGGGDDSHVRKHETRSGGREVDTAFNPSVRSRRSA